MTITLNGTTGITLPNGSASAPAATGSDTDTGIVYGTNTVSLATGGTTAVTVDSSQNVGIGTSSPATKLNVVSADNAASTDIVRLSSNNGAVSLGFGYDTIRGTVIKFATGGTERGQFDSSGNLLVNKTSNLAYSPKLQVSGLPNVTALGVNCDPTSSNLVNWYYNTSIVASVSTNGSTVTYGTSSDYRLKDNVQPMADGLSKVMQLKPSTWTWKRDGSDGQGFIAHELQAVVPDCVTGEKDAVDEEGKPVYQGIDTSFLVATLTAAIQELKAELDTVKTELATLKGTA